MGNAEPGLIETMASAEYENTDCSAIAPQTTIFMITRMKEILNGTYNKTFPLSKYTVVVVQIKYVWLLFTYL